MRINAVWHEASKMPKNPTLDQRLDWHIKHAKNCQCWPIPPKLQAEINKRNKN